MPLIGGVAPVDRSPGQRSKEEVVFNEVRKIPSSLPQKCDQGNTESTDYKHKHKPDLEGCIFGHGSYLFGCCLFRCPLQRKSLHRQYENHKQFLRVRILPHFHVCFGSVPSFAVYPIVVDSIHGPG